MPNKSGTIMFTARQCVEIALGAYYSGKFGGKVWCYWDEDKRKYCIRGEGLPARPDLQAQYLNGWSLLDYIAPMKALKLLGMR